MREAGQVGQGLKVFLSYLVEGGQNVNDRNAVVNITSPGVTKETQPAVIEPQDVPLYLDVP